MPWNESGPPVLITAGNRGEIIPAQIDRVGRLGDGVITTYCTDDDCRTLRELCDAAFEKHQRPRPGFPMCVYTTVRIENNTATAQAVTTDFLNKYYGGGVHFHGLMGLGAPGEVIDTLTKYEAAGVTDLCIRFAGVDQLRQIERFVRDVAPAFV
jgi:alkanesulfonate monooxygenase SsuD/methylene tetrahydromethanopterin reductase-like flavin-dependent oxidoreductase (luciferase family)